MHTSSQNSRPTRLPGAGAGTMVASVAAVSRATTLSLLLSLSIGSASGPIMSLIQLRATDWNMGQRRHKQMSQG